MATESFATLTKLSLQKLGANTRADFRFAPLNVFLLVALMLAGLLTHCLWYGLSVSAVIYAVVAALLLAVLIRCCQIWETVVISATVITLAGYLILRHLATALNFAHFTPVDYSSRILLSATVISALIAPCVQIALQWERAVLLRFGKFVGIRGPGLFLVVPVIDKVAHFVDQRIRVSDFRAETTLTKDTVPVNVDAIAFWMVWDAEKAVLEVEDFASAVLLSAQTALRDAIGRSELATLLSHRDQVGKEIREVLDAKTNPWGITAQAVEIRDIIIPQGLEDAMSKQAQAERERQSRIILGTAETEIAEKFAKASIAYQHNPVALHLRAMNMVFEGLKQKGSMVIVPSTAVETMGLGAIGGLTALGQQPQTDAPSPKAELPPNADAS